MDRRLRSDFAFGSEVTLGQFDICTLSFDICTQCLHTQCLRARVKSREFAWFASFRRPAHRVSDSRLRSMENLLGSKPFMLRRSSKMRLFLRGHDPHDPFHNLTCENKVTLVSHCSFVVGEIQCSPNLLTIRDSVCTASLPSFLRYWIVLYDLLLDPVLVDP